MFTNITTFLHHQLVALGLIELEHEILEVGTGCITLAEIHVLRSSSLSTDG